MHISVYKAKAIFLFYITYISKSKENVKAREKSRFEINSHFEEANRDDLNIKKSHLTEKSRFKEAK